jgi:hypothetical protein
MEKVQSAVYAAKMLLQRKFLPARLFRKLQPLRAVKAVADLTVQWQVQAI